MTSAPQDNFALPSDLPVPENDGGARHLMGHPLPFGVSLNSTLEDAEPVDLFNLSLRKPILLFIYPRTGTPGEQVPKDWDAIPGARGCTPHLCSVRDSIDDLKKREPTLEIFGLSAEETPRQREVVQRLHLPFPLLSDVKLELAKALELPTFDYKGQTLLKRMTLLMREGQITRVDYPVFPPNEAAKRAVSMLTPDHELADAHAQS